MTIHTVDDYLATLPEPTRDVIGKIREIALAEVPDGVEVISYQIPTVKVDGKAVVHYAGWKKHVSLYPGPAAEGDLAQALAPYAGEKGTLKFQLAKPIPYDLIRQAIAALTRERLHS